MNDREDKVNWKKIGLESIAAALAGAIFTPLVSELATKILTVEWRVPEWITVTAEWFLSKTPISNAAVISTILMGTYAAWTTTQILKRTSSMLVRWKGQLNGVQDELVQAASSNATLRDANKHLQLELATASAELSKAKRELDLAHAELEEKKRVPVGQASHKPENTWDKSYKEATLGGIHWRWGYMAPTNKIWNVRPFCDYCDHEMDLDSADIDFDGPTAFLTCPCCGKVADLPLLTAESNINRITSEIERRIRIDVWRDDLNANAQRVSDIFNSVERRRPVKIANAS